MKQSHIALIVSPSDQEIVAVPWLREPTEPTHSGFTNEETEIMNHYHRQWRKYDEELKLAIKCDQSVAIKILKEQYPDRKVFPHIRVHYNITDVTLGELLGKPRRNFVAGETVTCMYASRLPQNEIRPNLTSGKEYPLQKVIIDSKGNQHFDVGLKSHYAYIRSYETGEQLPDGDKIHWCHPFRFI
ncbi:MAG: hypothetical protein KBB91_00755 [Candidatus Pacebacteria bacterium]|jgi:hypothetical protein|nr:hypothetical protein [Candidatus Paceibacterota bacterium]MBP9700936.1 hypothetical protein [Candidatus Paceibacterota bacterium]